MKLRAALLCASFITSSAYATDMAFYRLVTQQSVVPAQQPETEEGQVPTPTTAINSQSEEGLVIEPKIGAGEDTLTPSITFGTNKNFQALNSQWKVNFGLTASTSVKPDDATEMANDFILDGGDINFNLGLQWAPFDSFGVEVAALYSLVSTSEIGQESTNLKVESEITTLQLNAAYAFNSVVLEYSYNRYEVSDNGSAEQAMFNNLLDGKNGSSFGITIPFTQDKKDFLVKFERAKLSGLDDAIFRVSFVTDF